MEEAEEEEEQRKSTSRAIRGTTTGFRMMFERKRGEGMQERDIFDKRRSREYFEIYNNDKMKKKKETRDRGR